MCPTCLSAKSETQSVRVNSWIVLLPAEKTIHEITRRFRIFIQALIVGVPIVADSYESKLSQAVADLPFHRRDKNQYVEAGYKQRSATPHSGDIEDRASRYKTGILSEW